MRVRLTSPAARVVRATAKRDGRSAPKQASVLVLRGAGLSDAVAPVKKLPAK